MTGLFFLKEKKIYIYIYMQHTVTYTKKGENIYLFYRLILSS